MPATYEPIASITLSSNGTFLFSSIPQTYTDLIVSGNVRGVNGGTVEYLLMKFNGSATGHTFTQFVGDGASASSNRNTPGGISPSFFYCGLMAGGTANASNQSTVQFQINSYSNTGANKTAIMQIAADANGSGTVGNVVGSFLSTAAITSIQIQGSNGTVGNLTLYGIRAA
jgi:hypothetical protein